MPPSEIVGRTASEEALYSVLREAGYHEAPFPTLNMIGHTMAFYSIPSFVTACGPDRQSGGEGVGQYTGSAAPG